MLVPISEIKVPTGRREVKAEDVADLADSIKQVGLLNPITITPDHTLIAGNHRLEAAKQLALDAELASLQEVQATLSTQLSQWQADEQTKNANRLLAEKVVDIGKLNTELVDMLIDRVYVYPQQKIEIVWKAGGFGSGGKEIQKNF